MGAETTDTPALARLSSWKEIAAYLGASVRTVQRWERDERLPVHRHEHASVSTIYAFRSEVDAWLESRREPETGTMKALPALRRLIVVPFRLLRPDSEIEFLAFSLADAITASLSGLESLVLRSSFSAARYAGETDLKRIAAGADVQFVLAGTLLRSGGRLRVTTQLVDGVSGTLIASQSIQGCLEDIFQLQDEIVRRVVDSLALPLNARERKLLSHDVPASAAAYENYLRANELAYNFDHSARDLYLRCLEEDPNYAPAWARLGRCCRVIAKFGGDQDNFTKAGQAFGRALELNPDLALAHNQLAYLEADSGRAGEAMVRLVKRAQAARSDPELFAGLVHVCRFCGLLEASLSAHEHASRLDPYVRTSVCHTYFMRGDYHRALETCKEVLGYMGPLALLSLGREREAMKLGRESEQTSTPLPLVRNMFSSIRALAEGARAEALQTSERAIGLIVHGPEELYYQARHLAHLSECGRALAVLGRAVGEGFFCYPALARDPWLHPLRDSDRFTAILDTARERHSAAVRAFVKAGGERLLGPVPPLGYPD